MTEAKGAARGSTEYRRGLLAAAAIVSRHSGMRRDAGEMQAMYALNTVWHAIDELARIEEASAASARNAPPESSAALSTEGKEK